MFDVETKAMRLGLIAAALVVGAGTVYVIYDGLFSGATAQAQATLDANRADAAITAAQDATSAVANIGDKAAAEDRLTQDNTKAIMAAPGATIKVDTSVGEAGITALCKRAAYRDTPRCTSKL